MQIHYNTSGNLYNKLYIVMFKFVFVFEATMLNPVFAGCFDLQVQTQG